MLRIISNNAAVSKQSAWWNNPPAGDIDAANRKRDQGLSTVFNGGAPSNGGTPSATVMQNIPGFEPEVWFRYSIPKLRTLADLRAQQKDESLLLGRLTASNNRLYLDVFGNAFELFNADGEVLGRYPDNEPITNLLEGIRNLAKDTPAKAALPASKGNFMYGSTFEEFLRLQKPQTIADIMKFMVASGYNNFYLGRLRSTGDDIKAFPVTASKVHHLRIKQGSSVLKIIPDHAPVQTLQTFLESL